MKAQVSREPRVTQLDRYKSQESNPAFAPKLMLLIVMVSHHTVNVRDFEP